jgi:iron complex outermembrane receptor protein
VAVLAPRAGADEALRPVYVPVPDVVPGAAERAPAAALTVVVPASPSAVQGTADLLRAVPGAVVRDYGGPGQLATVSLRGASSDQVLVLLDGVPVTSATGPSVNLATLPLAFVDRLEVLRGSLGALLGPGALGGAVNLVTRAPSGPAQLQGSVTVGSFGTAQLAAAGQGAVGPGALLVSGTALGTQGAFSYAPPDQPVQQRANNDVRQGALLGRYVLALGDARLDVTAQVEAGEQGLAGTTQNPSAHDRLAQDLESVQARLRAPALGGELTATGFARHARDRVTLGGAAAAPADDWLQGVEGAFDRTLGDHALSARLRVSGEQLTGPAARQRPDLGLGLADEWLLWDGRLSVLPAARLDRVDDFTGFSPALGAVLRPVAGLELRAQVGRSFRPPSFAELYVDQGVVVGNPRLRPETSTSVDLGVAWARGPWHVSAGVFGALYGDLIVYELYPPLRTKPFNVGTAGVAGAEVEAAFRPVPQLVLSGAYSHQRSEDLLDDARYYQHELPFHPRHTGSLRAQLELARLRVHGDALAQSQQWINRANTTSLPGRVELQAGADVQPLADLPLWVGFDVKNLLDARSFDLYGYPLPGRSGFVTVRLAPTPSPTPEPR